MVASLATTVMAIVRAQVMSTHGIPLGLLSSPFRFNDIAYFWSPSFLFAAKSIPGRLRAVATALVLITCGFLAAVVGPSTALLIVPYTENSWSAGGTDFWLVGSDDTLWPDHVNANHTGGVFCLNPNDTQITTAPLYMSSCPWAGYSQLAEGLKNRHFDWQSNVTFNDGVVKRQFTRHQEGADIEASAGNTWALGTHVATARISRLIADEWVLACHNGSSTKRLGSRSNFKNATDGLGTAMVNTWLPFSRVACWMDYTYNISSTEVITKELAVSYLGNIILSGDSLLKFVLINFKFPLLPEFAPKLDDTHVWNATVEMGRTFEDKKIATHWIGIPPPETRNHLAAAMLVEISSDTGEESRLLVPITCSIDARWTRGTIFGSSLPLTDNMVFFGSIASSAARANNVDLAPVSGPDWRFAQLDQTWLNALLPLLGGMNSTRDRGWTTAASMFAYAGLDNSTGMVAGWPTLCHTLESTIATLIVDGMSRIGLADNGGNIHQVQDRYKWMRWLPSKVSEPGSYFDRLLDGKTIVLPPNTTAGAATTRMHWDVTVSGLAYKASSTAIYLAIAVMFSCTIIGALHSAHMLITRRSSEAWDSIEEMIVLSQLSRPSTSAELANTSGGIHACAALKTRAQILQRTGNALGNGEEEIQLFLGHTQEPAYKLIQEDKSYGRNI